ncbi:molybdopterin-dependent oxidoreductase [Pseudonocardia nantongensis]|uniref:molybdopterin-dependent oxidoreductase n=1 Tax=Pseudonocardia nantongensis TaxID=1181885 RepID=UPI003979CF0E
MTATLDPTPPAPLSVLPRGRAVLTGVLGVGSALAAGDLVAGLVAPPSSPFLAVGDQFIRITPEWLKQLAIGLFGVYDKVALLAGMAVVIAVLAVVAGLVARRRPGPGLAVVTVLGLLALVCTVIAPAFGAPDLIAPLVALVVGTAVFGALHRAFARATTTGEATGPGAGLARRRALSLAGGVALGSVAAAAGGRLLGGSSAGASPSAVGPLPPAPQPRASALPPDVDFPGTPAWLTPTRDFYRIDTALQVPRVPVASWTLRVHGMVERELNLTFDALRARRLIEVPITMTCVSNPVGGNLMSNARFLGVPLAELLAEAGVRPGAEQLLSTSVDGFTTGTAIGPVTDGRDAMLAIGMNGEALPVEHGFPVRMVVPGLYGYVSGCKWITDIEVTTWAARQSYWLERGWGREGPIKTQSRIDTPAADATVPAGPVTVAGTSWAQRVGINRVEVSVDGGGWRPAELGAEVGVDTWRMWRTTVDLAPGSHTLRVRATDRTGTVQTGREQVSIPDGATGWHTVPVTAA